MGRSLRFGGGLILGAIFLAAFPGCAEGQAGQASQAAPAPPRTQTTQDYNIKLEEMLRDAGDHGASTGTQDYLIGVDDLLDMSVYEAPDLNRTVRVSAEGQILLPLLGEVRAAGLTPSGLARVLEDVLRKTYMKDPHVGIFVREMQSHPVSVFGAVAKPGVYQIRGAKTLIEVLSMAQGLAADAGDKVIVERQGSGLAAKVGSVSDALQTDEASHAPEETPADTKTPAAINPAGGSVIEVQLKKLLGSGDARYDVLVYPGDVVKVARADLVYVVGEVRKPGGFQLSTNENISVLQALALAEGLTRTSAANRSRVIRTDPATGNRTEIAIDIRRILAGKAPDEVLQPRDIVFVPNSTGKIALYRGVESALGIGSGLLIYRTP